jgi:hypothetical protein
MRRFLLLLVALVLGCVILLLFWPSTPTPPAVEPTRPPAPAKPPPKPLQADAEGSYVPGYPFTVNGFQFTGFTLRPDAFVTFVTASGSKEPAGCVQAVITADAVHLRCDGPQGSTVTIDGRFRTRLATTRLDIAVLNAVVSIRSGSGEVLYSARDQFVWRPNN